jgi:hypothetical protein
MAKSDVTKSASKGPWLNIRALLLSILFVTLLGFLGWMTLQNHLWKLEVENLAGYQGRVRAKQDYKAGLIRIFVIMGEREEDKFSGTNDGPFQVWYPLYFPDAYPLRHGTEVMVDAYNKRMKWQVAHPNASTSQTNGVTETNSP